MPQRSLEWTPHRQQAEDSLPVDLIRRPTGLARIGRLIAVTGRVARVAADFKTKRSTMDYPAPVQHPGAYPLIVLK